MAVRYFFEFSEGTTLYRGEFSNENYTDSAIELTGSASLTKDTSNDPAQPIQAKAVNVNLLATVDQPLEDIWNEDDRYWLFTYYEDSRAIFQGYASTEDMEQSYTSNKWFLNFDCLDHLSYIEDYAYTDTGGAAYTGQDTLLNIIRKCISKGYNENDPNLAFITSHFVQYNSGDVFNEVSLDQSQFYEEDGEAQDCKTILEDILKSLGCFIIQYRLNYVIIALKEYVRMRTESVPYRQYNSSGVLLSSSLNFQSSDADRIGSEINNFESYFINANQSFLRRRFYNTFRARHEFELVEQALTNPELDNDLSTIEGWTLNGTWASLLATDRIRIIARTTSGLNTDIAVTSDIVPVKTNDTAQLTYEFEVDTALEFGYIFALAVEVTNGVTTYKLVYRDNLNELIWQRSTDPFYDNDLFYTPNVGLGTSGTDRVGVTFDMPAIPIDGDFTVTFRPPRQNDSPADPFNLDLYNVNLSPISQEFEGEESTVRRTDKTTGAVPDTYQIRFNTTDRTLVKNIYLDSSGNQIQFFQRIIDTATINMLEELALMFMNLYSENHIEFSGGIKNNNDFFPKELDKLGSHFVVVSETKDFTRNISECTLLQLQNTELDVSDYTIFTERIFRETIKPAIES